MKSNRAPSSRAGGLVLAGALGLAGLGVGATLGPVAASAATGGTQAVTDRVTQIKDALAGLVKNGTINQSQADKVASTLATTIPDRGFGGHHGGGRGVDLDTAAGVIGVTTDQLQTQLQAGKTLAQIAQTKGISQTTLVSKLVTAEKADIAAKVKAGTLTQAQANSLVAGLQASVTQQVTSTCQGGGGFGHHGDHDGDGPGGTGSTAPTPTPSASSGSTLS
jgi:hypothetical protein